MSDKPVDRRRFFRDSLRELLKPLADAIDPIEQVINQISELERFAGAGTSANTLARQLALRPPGALPEQQFLEICSRCGDCVKVCPAQCIKIDTTGRKGGGGPFIEVDSMPCVVCEGLQCMNVCPTGALVPTPLVNIDMGTAVWNEMLCVRARGEECMICVDRCPIGEVAIEAKENVIEVHPDGCIGCGVCQYYCPTDPKSIVVIPKSARES